MKKSRNEEMEWYSFTVELVWEWEPKAACNERMRGEPNLILSV
jgi:hypothetical protein